MLATPEGTARYAARHTQAAKGHWRNLRGLTVGSIGMGSYLGPETDEADGAYKSAALRALGLGCNLFDTAINYRSQRSERAIGRALQEAFEHGKANRAEVVVCTKGGYVPVRSEHELHEGYLATGLLAPEDLVGGVHAMTPRYLRDQLQRSLRNLLLPAVDVYYVHNPEHQLGELRRDEVEGRLRAAFAMLEEECEAGRVGCYGVATWNGLRASPEEDEHLGLARLLELAAEARREAGLHGEHRFGAVQAPLNLAMTEALTAPTQPVGGKRLPLLEAAQALGVAVMCSASILQGRLSRGLPGFVGGVLGLDKDVLRALQFTRSCPGVTSALVGMGRPEHAEEDLALAKVEPAAPEDMRLLFEAARGAR